MFFIASEEKPLLQSHMGLKINRSGTDPLQLLISLKVLKIATWNFDQILIQVLQFGIDIFDSLETMRFSAS